MAALTPVVILGGAENAVSVARSLSANGIKVAAVNFRGEAVRFSRYAHYIKINGNVSPNAWEQFLLGQDSDALQGSVLLACSDEAISIIVRNHAALSKKFLLEEGEPETRRELLDKYSTYQRAEEAGVPTVGYWRVRSRNELERQLNELRYPLVMKPLYSPDARVLKSRELPIAKAVLIPNEDYLHRRFADIERLKVGIVLMEYISGGDDRLCSYYTYLDKNGNPLVHLTKRAPRRFPRNSGPATYHVTKWIPEAAELGLKFFRHLRFKGLGNIEFKQDARDGKLKIIEANARFTASDCLVRKSGVNLALVVYNSITGRSQPAISGYREGIILCRPGLDALAAWQLYKRNELKIGDWLLQIARVHQLQLFEWRDPLPALLVLCRQVWRGMQMLLISRLKDFMRRPQGQNE